MLSLVERWLLDRWAVGSQLVARRNAMLAATEAVRRRVERDDVTAYLAQLEARSTTEEVRVTVVAR